MSLKKRTLKTIVSSIFALGFLSVATSAKAQNLQPLNCTNSLLRGHYAASASGFTSGSTPFNLIFLDKFDGNGNITGISGSTSSDGQISQNLSNTGTYQVNSDCTVTLTFTSSSGNSGNSTNFGVIIDSGKRIRYIGTESGQNISGTFERVNY